MSAGGRSATRTALRALAGAPATVALAAAWAVALAGSPLAAEPSPHTNMVKADGSLDMQTCGTCHTPDMGLLFSKLETCTLCHLETTHGGSLEHIRADPESVTRAMAGRPKEAVVLPLTEKGGIWCGTCHVFHAPEVLSESWLPTGWVPPESGLPGAVREGVLARWARLVEAHGETGPGGAFAAKGTRQLRLPVENGSLCLQCHPAMGGAAK